MGILALDWVSRLFFLGGGFIAPMLFFVLGPVLRFSGMIVVILYTGVALVLLALTHTHEKNFTV